MEIVRTKLRKFRLNRELVRFASEAGVVGIMVKKLSRVVLYLTFMVFFTISTVYVAQEQDLFHMASNLRSQIADAEFEEADSYVKKTFWDIETIGEVQQWMRGPLARSLYTGASLWVENYAAETSPFPGTVFGFNRMVGGVRISQLRMKADQSLSCPYAPSNWKSSGFNGSEVSLMPCVGVYGDFDVSEEEKEAFGFLPFENGSVSTIP